MMSWKFHVFAIAHVLAHSMKRKVLLPVAVALTQFFRG